MQCSEITKKGDRCKNLVLKEDTCNLCTLHYNIRNKNGTLKEMCQKPEKTFKKENILLTDKEILEMDITPFLNINTYSFGKYIFYNYKEYQPHNIHKLSEIFGITVGQFFIKDILRLAYEKISSNKNINFVYAYLLKNYDYYLKEFTKNGVLKDEKIHSFYYHISANKNLNRYIFKKNDKEHIYFFKPIFSREEKYLSLFLKDIKELCKIFNITIEDFKNALKIREAFEKIAKTEEFRNNKYDFYNICYNFILENYREYSNVFEQKNREENREERRKKIEEEFQKREERFKTNIPKSVPKNTLYKTKKVTYKNKEYIMNSYKSNNKITFSKWMYDSFDIPENSELKDFKKMYYAKMRKNHPDTINSPKRKKIGEDNTKFYNALYEFVTESFENV
uniref:J domain-containing protein n=1 Tax=viral metagenome TaxID=1070528 RepID=A0A6C0AEF0_9ZZZZ